MAAINKNSTRQRVINLEVGGTLKFPVSKLHSIRSLLQGLKLSHGHKYETVTTEKQVHVTRIQ